MSGADVERRPTRAAAVPVGLAVVIGLLATSTGTAWLAAAAVAPVALGVASVLAAVPVALRLQAARMALTGPARARVGEQVTHRLHLGWSADRDEITVHVVQAGTAPWVGSLELGGGAGCHEHDLVRAAVHRGRGEGAEVRLVVTDALRLFRWSRTVAVPLSLVVHPRRTRPVPVPAGARGSGAGGRARPSRSGDLAGVRGWQRGDAAGDVHWRATARTGLPVVTVREQPGGVGCTLVLAGPVAASDEDRVALCAATGAALRSEEPTTAVLAVPGPGSARRLPAGATSVQLDWWAGADLSGSTAPRPADVLGAVGGTGPVVVIGTAALDEAWWSELQGLALRSRTSVVRVP